METKPERTEEEDKGCLPYSLHIFFWTKRNKIFKQTLFSKFQNNRNKTFWQVPFDIWNYFISKKAEANKLKLH